MDKNKVIRFANTAKFLFNGDNTIVINRLNGQWIKIPRQCYEILLHCSDKRLTDSDLDNILVDDEDRLYMAKLLELLNSMECLYIDSEPTLKNISLAITHRCNLNCIHCMVDAECGTGIDYFNTETICSILDKIVNANPEIIVLTGGEPMLRNDFIFILTHLRNTYKGAITLMTNGTLFNKDNIKPVINRVNNIDISLDGADESSCAVVRGKGVFEKVVKNVKLLKENGFENISLSMVMTNNNTRYIEQFYELNKSLNTKPVLRALAYDGRTRINKEIINNAITTDIYQSSRAKNNRDPHSCSCSAGYNQLTIEANGDIFPCNLFVTPEFKLGNIENLNNISSIIKDYNGFFITTSLQKYEPSEFLKCKECNINYFCWSCLYPMHILSDNELNERCKYKKQLLANIWG